MRRIRDDATQASSRWSARTSGHQLR